ncbi:MAG: flagellar motor protein MotA [Alphaproteobacteria bacterium]
MTRPRKYLVSMAGFVVFVAVLGAFLHEWLANAFFFNAPLNSVILGVLVIGIIYIVRRVLILNPEVEWIERFRRNQPGLSEERPPRLLAPMATMLGERKGRLTLSAPSMRSLLDGISARLDEARDISRYLVGVLIFLGLLGTFWGLIETIVSIKDVIRGMSVGSGDVTGIFTALKENLEGPLAGMGTSFSSSLFGLAGSLILGFLDLQAGQAMNRFYNELEEWLSGSTRLSSGGGIGEGDQSVPAYIQALLEQTADSLENLQRTLARGEDSRAAADTGLRALTDRLTTLTDQMRTEQTLMLRLAENQRQLMPVLQRLADAAGTGGFGLDEATRGHIRNLDVHMARLVEETSTGRVEAVRDIRSEIKLLARTIAAMAEEGPS